MEDTHNAPMTLDQLAAAYQQIQTQFNNAQDQVTGLQNELKNTLKELNLTKKALQSIQSYLGSSLTKSKKPDSSTGKSSVRSWIIHVNNYVGNEQNPQALNVAVSYLRGAAHEWWIGYKETEQGIQVTTQPLLQEEFIGRFETLNKIKIAQDTLARWKQIKDVLSFNEDFQNILLDIPDITVEEQL